MGGRVGPICIVPRRQFFSTRGMGVFEGSRKHGKSDLSLPWSFAFSVHLSAGSFAFLLPTVLTGAWVRAEGDGARGGRT